MADPATDDPAAMVEAVLDVLAPVSDLAGLAYASGLPVVRVPIFLIDYDGTPVMPSTAQVRALAEQIVTAIRTAARTGTEPAAGGYQIRVAPSRDLGYSWAVVREYTTPGRPPSRSPVKTGWARTEPRARADAVAALADLPSQEETS
jgi:hypothetical protein